ncbi:AAA-ATPase At3g28580-like [Oryza brachyantha]|uniref:AAA-ATPase At3g28580-like n=1 Tax=Oryza brachyantha TaxID=4533 RepID=UPI001ADBCC7E|nr:AAA-ATPase At3g28580-like [Oryza brachyantha]
MPVARKMRRAAAGAPGVVERFAGMGSALAGVMFLWSMLSPFLPRQLFELCVGRFLRRHGRRLAGLMDPYLTVTISEHEGDRMRLGDVYDQAKAYLSHRCARLARSLRAERAAREGDRFLLTMGDGEEVYDEFQGATVWWQAVSSGGRRYEPPWYGGGVVLDDDRRAYRLMFHRRHRDLVVESYLPHVCREGRAIMLRNRGRKLFTNLGGDRYRKSAWSYVAFEHPSTFETLAMDPAKKKEIMDDLDAFRKGKDYYARIGKAWKRGYLLHGPPGTGKSTMIAAMANYLDYDVYDVELTSVATNTDLRRLFIETKGKSIIVIEDIDCSVDLTGKRKKKTPTSADPDEAAHRASKDESATKVTLSGLLNVIDGLWSACGGERIVVFTTNHVDKLDPALIRRGRMDKHIEMSYCCFETFKILAKNYLAMDAHHLFDDVESLLHDAKITPADVAEHLMLKCAAADADEATCLASLVKALEKKAEKEKNASEEEETVVDE